MPRARRSRALELELFGPEDENSNVVTAIKLPESIDGAKVPKTMRDKYGITIAGGQNQLKGKIARIAHCGYYGAFDIVTTFAALEMTLKELGADVELGAGVAAAQRVFLEAGVPVAGVSAPRVLVKEKIGDSGVQLLRDAGFDVELGVDWEDGELERRIGEFDGMLIRSATKLDADLIAKADRLRAVGRAGVGVDNVDVDAATKRGIIVANAPAVERDHRGRAHGGDAARARAEHPAGALGARRRARGTGRSTRAPSCTRRRSG